MSQSDDPCVTPPSPPPPEYESVIDKLRSSSFVLEDLMQHPSDEPQDRPKEDTTVSELELSASYFTKQIL